jgi:DNA (cytosine-5)-methyltransferase 1
MSVCSGIEAASVAWSALQWQPVAFSEIDPFACAVLAHRYAGVPNHGDMTRYEEWPDAALDILVGGTPCQSFSVAGKRGGMDDARGDLARVFVAVAGRYRPGWLVWENVPGILSSNEGRDFGAILGGLAELGYGFAYRVLDAQYFGVPQQRRRVFVVGCLGSWQRAAAVLFERESLRGDSAPLGFTRDDSPAGATVRAHAHLCLTNAEGAEGLPYLTRSNLGKYLNNQTPLIAFDSRQDPISGPVFGSLSSSLPQAQAVCVPGGGAYVRRITPRECERLMGLPDDYTLVPYRGKPAADGPRYAAIGNSMAVPVMQWIGERIANFRGIGMYTSVHADWHTQKEPPSSGGFLRGRKGEANLSPAHAMVIDG